MRRNLFVGMLTAALACFAWTQAHAAEVERLDVAGKLQLDYHARIMAARDDAGRVVNWNNCGVFMGSFGDFGFDGDPEAYPVYVKSLDGSPAVVFDGADRFRHVPNPTPESICDDAFSVEIWAKDVAPGDGAFIAWGGFALTPSDFDLPAGKDWRHLAAVVADGVATLTVDGEKAGEKRVGTVEPEQIVVGDGLKGAIAAIRVHDEAMTAEQIRRNVAGGVLLGTTFEPNIDPENLEDPYFGDPSLPQFRTVYSEHFRSTWEPEKDENNVMEARVFTQLTEAEKTYETYEQLGYHMPIVSADENLRGDGVKYKIPTGNDWGLAGGGGWMGWSGRGFGFSIAGPGWFSGHELAHGTQGHQLHPLSGNFWEVHASWMPTMAYPEETEPVGVLLPSAHLFPGNGRNYYHTWQMFDHFTDTPEYGPLFVTKMWNAGAKDERTYPWIVATEIDPDPSTPMGDECVKMARRCITWDFGDKSEAYARGAEEVDVALYRTILEPLAYRPGWYRSPKAYSPLQWGFNICPLQATSGKVTADLQGYVDAERGSRWSASFVAVQADGSPRYSEVWNEGETSFRVRKDDQALYLVVAATPTKIAPLETCGDYRSDDWAQFPYRVGLKGAEPLETLKRPRPDVPGKAHPNGGGFVADTAHVDATAWVGPDAMVTSGGQVLGNARIEDFAVVQGTVKDDAVVSDFAFVRDTATVRGRAKVRNRAIVEGGADVGGHAKVLEHAVVLGSSTKVSGYVAVKGSASVYGGNVRGTAMVDGHYAKGNDLDKGAWFTWSWGAGQNDGEVDEEFGGVYCEYTFERDHPYLAWDTHGVTWGYLVGDPQVEKRDVRGEESNVLTLNGENQFVEMTPDVADMSDVTIALDAFWEGDAGEVLVEFAGRNGESVRLVPSDAEGKLAFTIRAAGKEQTVQAAGALPRDQWVNVQIMLGEDLATLFVDGEEAGRNDAFTLNPDDMRAAVCYLGRGAEEGFFKGAVDNFAVYGLALKDRVAPSPDPSEWRFAPEMAGPSTAVMHAFEASDPRGVVEYRFIETTGAEGGVGSDWQSEPTFVAKGLQPGTEYAYEVVTRDVNGNVSEPAPATRVLWHAPEAFVQPDGDAAPIVFEAEHYSRKIDGPAPWKWELVKSGDDAFGEGWMAGVPDTGVQYTPFAGPRLDYRIHVKQPGEYRLWLRGSGPYWTGDSVNIALDYQIPEETSFIDMGFEKFRWVRFNPVFRIDEPGEHVLTLWMREDGTMLDRMLLTPDPGFKPSETLDAFDVPVGKGPEESPRR